MPVSKCKIILTSDTLEKQRRKIKLAPSFCPKAVFKDKNTDSIPFAVKKGLTLEVILLFAC